MISPRILRITISLLFTALFLCLGYVHAQSQDPNRPSTTFRNQSPARSKPIPWWRENYRLRSPAAVEKKFQNYRQWLERRHKIMGPSDTEDSIEYMFRTFW